MANVAEQYVCEYLNRVLKSSTIDARIEDSEDLRQALTGLARLLPIVFEREFPELQKEGLDALFPVRIHKTAEQVCEMFGHALMLSNQTLQPIYLIVRLHDTGTHLIGLECKLGLFENKRYSYGELHSISKKLYAVGAQSDQISWGKTAKHRW